MEQVPRVVAKLFLKKVQIWLIREIRVQFIDILKISSS
jgi:hypothetical protein